MKFSLHWLRSYMDLPEDAVRVAALLAEAGLPVDSVDPWGADHQLDVDVMANRPDCMGHLGLARELAARLGRDLRRPAASLEPAGTSITELAAVKVEAQEMCPRYTALAISGVSIGPSPDWLEDRLASIGQRSINNVVDVTNLVLHEYGQPLHAFDLDRLSGHRIVVRRPRPGETIDTLDGENRQLETDFLVIADAERPVALAGVMGGAKSEISATTTRVLLESAHFDPVTIRRATHRLQMHTDASHRFERGTDPGVTLEAARRAAALIIETAGGTIAPGILDVGVEAVIPRRASLSLTRLWQLLGLQIEVDKAVACLTSLGFEVEPPRASNGDTVLCVTIPTWRGDVSLEVDLIEEVGRMVGYDAIPFTLPTFTTESTGLPSPSAGQDRVRRYLVASGYHEGLTFPLHEHDQQSIFSAMLEAQQTVVRLDNPLNKKMDTLRISLLPGLLQALLHNLNRGAENIKLFELGRVYCEVPDEATTGTGPLLPLERSHVAVVARGARAALHWSCTTENIGYFDLKGVLEGIATGVIGTECSVTPGDATATPFLAAAEGATIRLDGKPAGSIGRLAPEVAAAFDLPDDVFVFELDISAVPVCPPHIDYRSPPRYPASERDLALILDNRVQYDQIEAVIRQHGGDLLAAFQPFDRYAGAPIPTDSYSLAVRLSFRHPERTLTTEEVEIVQQKIVAQLVSTLGARLRDKEQNS